MADKAREQTDEKLEEMEKRLTAIYSRAHKEIGQAWTEYLEESGKEIEELQKEYEAAKKSGDRDEIKKLGKKLQRAKKERTILNKRFRDILTQTAEQISRANETAVAYINGELPEIYSLNYNAIADSVDGLGGYSFTLVDQNTVRNLIMSDESLLPLKEIDTGRDIRWNTKKLNAEILQGILQGEEMSKIAARLSKVEKMNEDAAIRNARTMVTSAECKGRQDSYVRAKKDGIILVKYWIYTHDSRVRDWHRKAGIDYSRQNAIDVDDFFIVNGETMLNPGDNMNGAKGHNLYNCRCSMGSRVVGFRRVE